jgi:hypothetical protein
VHAVPVLCRRGGPTERRGVHGIARRGARTRTRRESDLGTPELVQPATGEMAGGRDKRERERVG